MMKFVAALLLCALVAQAQFVPEGESLGRKLLASDKASEAAQGPKDKAASVKDQVDAALSKVNFGSDASNRNNNQDDRWSKHGNDDNQSGDWYPRKDDHGNEDGYPQKPVPQKPAPQKPAPVIIKEKEVPVVVKQPAPQIVPVVLVVKKEAPPSPPVCEDDVLDQCCTNYEVSCLPDGKPVPQFCEVTKIINFVPKKVKYELCQAPPLQWGNVEVEKEVCVCPPSVPVKTVVVAEASAAAYANGGK